MPPETRLNKIATFLECLAAESATALSLTDFLHAVLRSLRSELGYDSCAAAMLDDDADEVLVVRAASGLFADADGASIPADRGPWETVLRSGRTILVSRGEIDAGAGGARIRCAVYVPLKVRGQPVGVLCVGRPRPNMLREADLALLTAVGRYLAGALEVTRHLDRHLRDVSDANPLTGLAQDVGTLEVAHLRAFADRVEAEVAEAARTHRSFTIAVMDTDGDEAALFEDGANRVPLRVAEILAAEIRPEDLAIRYGGNGFLLLLTGATALEAQKTLASLGLRRLELETDDGSLAPFGMTWGTATWPGDGADLEHLLDAAERRLFGTTRAYRTDHARARRQSPLSETAVPFAAVRERAVGPARFFVPVATVAVALITGFALGSTGWLRAAPPQHGTPAPAPAVVAEFRHDPIERTAAPANVPLAARQPAAARSTRHFARAPRTARHPSARQAAPPAPHHYFVVSGPLPRVVAERRAVAMLDIGLMPTLTLTSFAPGRAVLHYGVFGSEQDAQTLARRVRTAGYTAAIVAQ